MPFKRATNCAITPLCGDYTIFFRVCQRKKMRLSLEIFHQISVLCDVPVQNPMHRIFQSLLSCRLRRADRGALPRVSRFLFPRAARSFVNSATQNGKAFRLPVFAWWTCAEYFAPAFPKSFLSIPARAASGGPTAERSPAFPASCSHALRALSSIPPRKTGRPFAFPSLCGGPARNRTAVLQGSSADTTRLVCDQISPAGSSQTTCSLGILP